MTASIVSIGFITRFPALSYTLKVHGNEILTPLIYDRHKNKIGHVSRLKVV